VLALATLLMASPLIAEFDESTSIEARISDGYVELSRESATNSNGALVYYGPPSGTKTIRSEPNKVEIRKASTCTAAVTPNCGSKHSARNDVCDALLTELYADSKVAVGTSPRQICFEGSSGKNQYCCVSWADDVDKLTKGDLATWVDPIFRTCTSNGITGKMPYVLVHSTCTTVCLSNRGTKCS
jgi:hypothetical protein